MREIKIHFWIVASFLVWTVTLIWQIVMRSSAWPYDFYSLMPNLVADVLSAISWLGLMPMLLALLLLMPVQPANLALKASFTLTGLTALIIPISSYFIVLTPTDSRMQLKTAFSNSLTIAVISLGLIFLLIFIPNLFKRFLKKEK